MKIGNVFSEVSYVAMPLHTWIICILVVRLFPYHIMQRFKKNTSVEVYVWLQLAFHQRSRQQHAVGMPPVPARGCVFKFGAAGGPSL